MMPGVWKGTAKTNMKKKASNDLYVYMYSIFLLLDKRMCSSIANECIRIPCTNNLRIPSSQPSRTVSKQNPLRLFRFQITVEI